MWKYTKRTLHLIVGLIVTNIIIATSLKAEILTFHELEAGHCLTLEYDNSTGKITLTEHTTNGCMPDHLSIIAGGKSLYAIVVKETDAKPDEYDFFNVAGKNIGIVVESTPTASIFETIITQSEVKTLNEAIRSNQGFNIGVLGYDIGYYAGSLFKHVVDDEKTYEDISSLKGMFQSQNAAIRKSIQKTLKLLGFYRSSIDGLYGSGTEQAFIQYSSSSDRNFNLKTADGLNRLFAELKYDTKLLDAIRLSDDLNTHTELMLSSTKDLVANESCSINGIKDFGGWIKSDSKQGKYFMDCATERYWLDISSADGSSLSKVKHLDESVARDMCWDYIRREVPSAKMQPINNSYTQHTIGSVTYVAGFKVKNIAGKTEKYYAYCVIQSDKTMEVNFREQ